MNKQRRCLALDLDAFRDELARRIEAFVASRADEDFADDAGDETPADDP